MLDVFRGLKGLLKFKHVTIDSSIFRLHYSISVTFMLAFSLIVTTRQYVGNPIDCVHSKDIPEDVLNTYCWIHSTYTIPSAFWKRIGIDVAHPGIDKTIDPEERRYVRYYQWVCFCLFFQFFGDPIDCVHTHDIPKSMLNTYCWIHSTYTIPSAFWKRVSIDVPHPGIDKTVDPDERRYVKYYQWVVFCLSFQAILFYIPRWLWKNWEAGKIGALKMDLDLGIISEAEKRAKKKLLLDYLYTNLKNHNFWAYRYFFCEFLALLNVFGQMFLMDRFFDGTFLTFGIEVISFAERDQEDRIDPMVYIFPRMTKCTFHKFGSSGEIEKHDAMCILPLNIVNEKIYIFIWFWMLLLCALTTMVLIYRVFIIFSPRMRAYLLYIRFRLVKKECINIIIKKTKMGDWFLLYMLGQNIDSIIFKEVVHELARKLGYHNKDIYDT